MPYLPMSLGGFLHPVHNLVLWTCSDKVRDHHKLHITFILATYKNQTDTHIHR